MEREHRDDGFTAIEDRFSGYTVYDRDGDRIGKVDDLFLDEHDDPEYIGVKTGFLGLRSTLIPMDLVRIDERRDVMGVSRPKGEVKDAPAFDDDEEITPEFEERVRSYFGLQSAGTDGHHGYGEYYDGEEELKVQRSEEELRAGTREREAGAMRVRKRVRTDRQQVRVPKRREEVHVERVPVNEEAVEAEIGEDEVVMPVVEEEIDSREKADGQRGDPVAQGGHRRRRGSRGGRPQGRGRHRRRNRARQG